MVGPIPRRNGRPPRRSQQEKVGLTRTIDISPRAGRDLREIQDYLDEKNPQAGLLFDDEADACLLTLASRPFSGRVVKGSGDRGGGLRSWPLSSRFWQYLVFYRVFAHSIRIVRVLHGARNVRAILRLPR